jgi:hypothetical protein
MPGQSKVVLTQSGSMETAPLSEEGLLCNSGKITMYQAFEQKYANFHAV